ncbi:hypothetical protein KO116_P100153 (plasmid) [Halomonas sp. KO116]|nr:hypothetical protein KO116_P100153 [Halomonas sp. KO116]
MFGYNLLKRRKISPLFSLVNDRIVNFGATTSSIYEYGI